MSKTYNITEFAELIGVSTKTLRRLDFCLIECQGEQHYRPIKKLVVQKKLLKQMKNDEMKKDYAVNVLHIPLYEVLYTNMSKQDVYAALDKFPL